MRSCVKSVLICSICAGSILFGSAVWSAAQDDGKALFEKRCIACHKLPDPENPPPEGWEERLEKMAPMARLKSDQKQNVLAYLLAHSQQSTRTAALEEDQRLFEEKCSRCHTLDRIFLEPLTDESRHHVISRMQARSGTSWLSNEDVERILNYLAQAVPEAKPAEPLPPDATAEEIFRVRCSACHTLERVYAQMGKSGTAQDTPWAHTVSRMRGKAPQWMTETEAKEIMDYLSSLSEPAG